MDPTTMIEHNHQRLQRREFKDFQPLFMLINSLDIIDAATRRDFVCKLGPVWQRYNAATKGAKSRRITALFLGDGYNSFDALFLVACDYVRRRQQHCVPLWTGHPLAAGITEPALKHLCLGTAGLSVLDWPAIRSRWFSPTPGPCGTERAAPPLGLTIPMAGLRMARACEAVVASR
jgi:hypothetical protein